MRPYLIQHLLEESCGSHPDKICIIEGTKKLSYQETILKSQCIAGRLINLGTEKGEHIGIILNKSIEQVISIMGVFYAGCVMILINPILRKEQISHIIKDCEIKTIIASQDTADKHGLEMRKAGVNRAFIFNGDQRQLFQYELSFDGQFNNLKPADRSETVIQDDTSHIIYTSGSTGMPKGIVISHLNTVDGARIVSRYTGLRNEDRLLGALPFNFDYGFNQLINTFNVGATLYLHNFFMPNDLLKLLEQEKISVFAGMAPIWAKIFSPKLTDISTKFDFSQLRVITNTGGKVPTSTVKKMRLLFSEAKIFLMYGLTEAFRSTFLNPDEIDRRPESIGKAVPNVQIMVLNKNGTECLSGEEGELVHRGALISKGYWNNPEKTRQVFRVNPLLGNENSHLETVVFSGDIVKRDEDGFIYYVGRKDMMIKTKGYRVSPAEVEELLSKMTGINGCVATGRDTEDDIALCVFVQLNENSLLENDIKQYCRKNFPFYLVPDIIVISEQFPLNANGKIDRSKIIRDYLES